MATTFLSVAGAIWWCLAVALLILTLCCGLAQPLIQKRRATAIAKPPVSAILPIKNLDPGFETAQASIFDQDYPKYEILISAAEVESPALDAARRIAATRPSRPCRFIHSDSRTAVSPKLNNLMRPLSEAQHDIVMTKDFEHNARSANHGGIPSKFDAGGGARRWDARGGAAEKLCRQD